ncbi:MAG: hypothetical protein QOG77_3809, partial [Solirubrobacteraceae bacterium]|nr:hypothetical protein [Solirubrobacteraceae bacterium]
MAPVRRACALLVLLASISAAPAAAAPVHFSKPLLVDETRAGGEPVM